MKNKFLKALGVSAAILAAGLGLAGCEGNKSTTTQKEENTTTETVTETTETSTTTTEAPTTTTIVKKDNYDDITKTLSLNKNYNSSSLFLENGIEEVTLLKATDGDTANFKGVNSGTTVTIRFYSVDTPESTGSVEKWGKSAAKYTEAKLSSAAAILLEGSETPPVVDSYGSRYLAYVWYKETADSAWKNLNLEIVENGFSKSKALVDDEYFDVFEEAQAFARSVPLHIWSEDEDPYFSEEAEEVSVEELYNNFSDYYNSEEGVGTKVRFDGYISGVSISASGTYTFKASDYDEDGKVYTINVYTGYTSSAVTKYLKVGSKFTMTGSVQYYSGSYQVSGLTYVALQTGGDYVTRISRAYYMQFNSNTAYETYIDKKTLYKNAIVTAASVDGTTLSITANAVNRYDYDSDDTTEATEFTFKCTVEAGFDATGLVGKSLSVNGIQEVEGSNIINVLKYSDFNFS